jgi:hypothetical protein
MSGLTDLQNAVAALTAEQVTFLTDVQSALQNGDSDAAVELVANQITALQQAQQAADPGAPTTTPPAPSPTS